MSFNILPINDIKEHSEDSTCECKPKIIYENGEMIIIHNAYDGREFKEQMIGIIKKQIKIDDLIDLI